ncbi:MAG: 2,3-diphosphoglycerate-dependent phosphoglycerate mutase [Kiloniellales bacterium]|nr:2,3-diphosphoglycerate-dependent phosphoglycerate mutase [Kiloniellales bacterium]
MASLVLVRHGKTEWVKQNRFAGWSDAPLSEQGREEASMAGRSLAERGIRFDLCHTSMLSRAEETLRLLLESLGQPELPRKRSWRLNERHYGALQGMNRTKAALEFGNDKIGQWRRDYRARPPSQAQEASDHPHSDPKYRDVDKALLPETESLEDAALRVLPWWDKEILPDLKSDKNVLVVAHTASIRGLVRHIESLSDEETEAYRIATCVPVAYRFDRDLALIEKEEIISGLSSRIRRFLNKHKPGKAISWI